MKLYIKSIGVVVVGIGLLGLTSGCAKKIIRVASGADQQAARATLKSPQGEKQASVLSRVSDLEKAQVSQEFDLDAGKRGAATDRDLPTARPGEKNKPFGQDPTNGFPNGSMTKGMLTTPASTSASQFDSQFSTSGLPSSTSFASEYTEDSDGLSSPRDRHEVRDDPLSSQSRVPRKGVTFSNGLHDIYFQFDSWRLTDASRRTLEANAEWLKANAHSRIKIEGHCDERGTQAYNFVLGEKRASMVQQYLSFLGVPHHQLIVTSFGKDKPKCQAFSENCFQKNRRAHFVSDLNVAVQ